MACEICGQKQMNCDCTAEEKRMAAEITELQERVAHLEGELVKAEQQKEE